MYFCEGEKWTTVVRETQQPIIEFDFLKDFSQHCRNKFHEPTKEITYRCVPTSKIVACHAQRISSIRCGYDMPIAIAPDLATSVRYIALVFQDPLRGATAPNTLTAGVPFALGDQHMRNKKRYGFVWKLVERIVGAGFGVWVTDANKLWLNPGEADIFSNDERQELDFLQSKVLLNELTQLRPRLTIAFGRSAQISLKKNGILSSEHPHPGVYGGKPLIESYGLEKGKFGYDARLTAAWERIEKDLIIGRHD